EHHRGRGGDHQPGRTLLDGEPRSRHGAAIRRGPEGDRPRQGQQGGGLRHGHPARAPRGGPARVPCRDRALTDAWIPAGGSPARPTVPPMPHYAEAAEFYDLLYQGEKDYAAEAGLLSRLIRERAPGAATLLDVGCGTGSHARALIDAGFRVDGIDLEPAFIDLARAKCPEGTFHVGDMTALDLPGRYDVVTCLFSAIGYVESETALRQAIAGMRRHLNPGGVLIVDPWFEPGQL